LITRFFAGIFGSAPVTITGGVLGDIWNPQQRGTAIVGYAFAVVGGPTLGVSSQTIVHPNDMSNISNSRLQVALSFLAIFAGDGPNM
jgi:MFS family permease